MKRPMLMLTLLAAPALALAARQAFAGQIAVHQTPAAPVPTITIPARSLVSVRRIANRFRVEQLLPVQVTLVSLSQPTVRATFQIGIHTALALHQGEIVRLKIVRAQP